MTTSTDTAFTRIHAQNVEIFKMVCAQAKTDMSIDEINHLITNLTEVRDVKASANSAKAKRLARMNAAKADPKMSDIIRRTNAELKRIGFDDGADDDKVCISSLNAAMTATNMDSMQCMTLKDACHALGLID
jgi:hypothetical protein